MQHIVYPGQRTANFRLHLKKYVAENYKRKEIIDFVRRDFPNYSWSIPTLDRRLRHFGIFYINKETPLTDVVSAVEKELKGPGKLLGYRALNHKLRTEHAICVPRKLVSDVQWDLDPEGVESRDVKKKKKKRPKKPFISDGPNWTFSLDGHDKLMGFQNSTFPIAVYGCLDTFSRKIIFLNVWDGNSNPQLIGKFFMLHLLNTHMIPCYLRVDKGTETGVMAAMQVYLMDKCGDMANPTDSVVYGPSTTNKIERWWKDLHERMEKYWKIELKLLIETRFYDPHCTDDRKMLAYIFIPVVQRECDVFARMWNSHRIRHQAGLELPTGIPNHMYAFPEQYGADMRGIPVTDNKLTEVGELASLENAPTDYLSVEERRQFSLIVAEPWKLEGKNVVEAYKYLKNNIHS